MHDQINKILADWDPVGVGFDLAKIEYIDYIPAIIENAKNEQALMKYLEQMLIDEMGLSYDQSNSVQYKMLKNICQEIFQICSNL